MWRMPNEDAYWESVRERMENPPRDPWSEPDLTEACLDIDECWEEIDSKFGGSIEELDEADLLEIVREKTGIIAESAEYDPGFYLIIYKYDEEAA